MRIRRIWIILIISLACFLVINAPAKILTPYLKSSINFPFTLNGSIWNGSMQSKYFDIVSWKVNATSLLLANVSTEIQVEIDKLNKINAEANINPFGKLKINITSGSLTTQYLQQFLYFPYHHTILRYQLIVFSSPSFNLTLGYQFNLLLAKDMSGQRLLGSSTGKSLNTIPDELFTLSLTN